LESCGYKAVNVVADRYQDLSSQMSALLAAVKLILKVHTSSTILGEELRQLDDRRQSAVAV
jgi:hypothetical protein